MELDNPLRSAPGHEESFPPPQLSAGYEFRKETIAGMGGKEEDAPKAVLHSAATALPLSTRLGHGGPFLL